MFVLQFSGVAFDSGNICLPGIEDTLERKIHLTEHRFLGIRQINCTVGSHHRILQGILYRSTGDLIAINMYICADLRPCYCVGGVDRGSIGLF